MVCENIYILKAVSQSATRLCWIFTCVAHIVNQPV